MKLQPLNLGAISICIGLGGFVLIKFISGNAEVSEQDIHPEASERVIQQRSVDTGSHSRTRQPSARPNRPAQQSSSTSLDQKLANLEKICRDGNPLTSGRAMLNWINSLAPEEFEAAVEKFRSLEFNDRHNPKNSDYKMLIAAWAEVDPIAALAYTSKKKDDYINSTGIVLKAWAARDPDAAIAWIKSKHPGDKANPFIMCTISSIVETDPNRAAALFLQLPSDYARDHALDALTPHLVEMGEEEAKKWISGISDKSLRSDAIARLAVAWAEKDPARSATWLLENINASTLQSVDSVFTQWTEKDPAAAIAGFQQIQDKKARSRALYGIVMGDDHGNPQATADLMNRYANDLTQETIEDYIWATNGSNPNLAINQIPRIQDESTRNELYTETLSSWLEDDEVAAKNWISSANLPASVIDSLNEPAENGFFPMNGFLRFKKNR